MISLELYNIVSYSDNRESLLIIGWFFYKSIIIYIYSCIILGLKIPMMVRILANICLETRLWIYRWISSSIATSMFLILCFLMVLLSAKAMVGHLGLQKCVILTNELGVDVARGICHSVNANFIIDSNDMLSNDCVAVQIVESLLEEDVPSE